MKHKISIAFRFARVIALIAVFAVTGIAVSIIRDTSAQITGTMNRPPSVQFQYGPATLYDATTDPSPELTTRYQSLSNLVPATAYDFIVRAMPQDRTSPLYAQNEVFATQASPTPAANNGTMATVHPRLPPPRAPHTPAPTVTILVPLNDTSASGTITITAACDHVGITKLTFYTDDTLQATLTAPPYDFSLDTTLLSNGPHLISAKAYDAAGNVGTSPSIIVYIGNPPASLSVTLSASPSSGPAPLTISLTATASGPAQGVLNYNFYCSRADSSSPPDLTINAVKSMTYTATNACTYSVPGTYNATVLVAEGSALSAEAETLVIVAKTDIPSQAAAVGYFVNTFSSTFTTSTVDINNTQLAGYQWYFMNFARAGALPAETSTVTINGDGSVTLDSNSSRAYTSLGTAVCLTARGNCAGDTWRGAAFGGGFYIEATMKFTPSNTYNNNTKPNTWPAFYAEPIEYISYGSTPGGDHWVGQTSTYEQFVEQDYFEYNTFNFRPSSTFNYAYSGTVHNWYGTLHVTCPPGQYCNVDNGRQEPTSRFQNSVITLPASTDFTQYHSYGFLWVSATLNTRGYAQFFFDGKLSGSGVYWSQFVNDGSYEPPPSWGAPWLFGVMDLEHFVPILVTGINMPLTVQSVNIWQGPKADNLEQ